MMEEITKNTEQMAGNPLESVLVFCDLLSVG